MAIAFDVHRPWTDGDAQEIGVDDGAPVRFWCTGLGAGRSYSDSVPPSRQPRIFTELLQTSEQMAQNRKTVGKHANAVASSKSSKKSFYIGLAVAAVAGIAAL